MEDLGKEYDEAVLVLEKSRSFGVMAYPGDEDHPVIQGLLSKEIAAQASKELQRDTEPNQEDGSKSDDDGLETPTKVKVEAVDAPAINHWTEGPVFIDLTGDSD
jgi:hypothetical protein